MFANGTLIQDSWAHIHSCQRRLLMKTQFIGIIYVLQWHHHQIQWTLTKRTTTNHHYFGLLERLMMIDILAFCKEPIIVAGKLVSKSLKIWRLSVNTKSNKKKIWESKKKRWCSNICSSTNNKNKWWLSSKLSIKLNSRSMQPINLETINSFIDNQSTQIPLINQINQSYPYFDLIYIIKFGIWTK